MIPEYVSGYGSCINCKKPNLECYVKIERNGKRCCANCHHLVVEGDAAPVTPEKFDTPCRSKRSKQVTVQLSVVPRSTTETSPAGLPA